MTAADAAVTLILDGVDITSSTTAAITVTAWALDRYVVDHVEIPDVVAQRVTDTGRAVLGVRRFTGPVPTPLTRRRTRNPAYTGMRPAPLRRSWT